MSAPVMVLSGEITAFASCIEEGPGWMSGCKGSVRGDDGTDGPHIVLASLYAKAHDTVDFS